MTSSTRTNYWQLARSPRYSLSFALPLLVAYEVLAFALSGSELTGLRNGADVLLKSLFMGLGGRAGLVVFGAVLVGGGATIAWRDRWNAGKMEPRLFGWMLLESIGYALSFGLVAGTLTGLLLPGLALVGSPTNPVLGTPTPTSLPTQLMISLGAGIYEELLFRVILVSGLAWLGRKAFGWNVSLAGIFAVGVGALVFSAFHYIGPYGDRLELGSFAFRAVAGVLFSSLYLLRGFGITAWTHALYDVFLTVGW